MNSNRKLTAIYWRAANKYRSRMFRLYGALSGVTIVEEVLLPIYISFLLSDLDTGVLQTYSKGKMAASLAVIAVVHYGSHFTWMYVVRRFWRWRELVMRDLAYEAFDHLSKMSYSFYANRFAGSLVNQVNKFVYGFERLSDDLTWNVAKLIIITTGSLVVLSFYSLFLVLGISIFIAIFVPLVWYFRRSQVPYNTRWSQAESDRTGQLADTISNVLNVKAFAGEPIERELFGNKINAVYERSMETMKVNMRQESITGFVARSTNIFSIVTAVWLGYRSSLDIGAVYLVNRYMMGILRRLWDLNKTFRTVTRVFGDGRDMVDIFDVSPEVADPKRPEKIKIKRGHIKFNKVDFSYEEQAELGFMKDFSISIKPNEKVGLVGPSGGGKTTITKLILRYVDIDNGSITIDGQNIKKITQVDLRRNISYVSQEPLLFHRSFYDNIRYGKPDASNEEVVEAAKLAFVHDFIESLPEGYETFVGERGVKLSGGQKQRVAIARAILKDAPILVLDEATSALDSESEQFIQKALKKLMEKKTSIVIAHRLSTIADMDRILVLDEGTIVEEGKHSQLVKNKSIYAKLWSHQSGGFIND